MLQIIQFYFHIRKLSKDMSGEAETELPLKVGNNVAVEVGDCINLSEFRGSLRICDTFKCRLNIWWGCHNDTYLEIASPQFFHDIRSDNSDLLSCVVVLNKNERLSRFLVTDRLQLILVEPDSRKAGWAIVRFVGLLQVCQFVFCAMSLISDFMIHHALAKSKVLFFFSGCTCRRCPLQRSTMAVIF